jgi:DNA-binding HxlR family transcriptional regulator
MQAEKCMITTTLNVLGGKWKIIILWHLVDKTRRFGEFKHLIQGINQKMLTLQQGLFTVRSLRRFRHMLNIR